MIVVGIYNTDRMRDLTPSRSLNGPDGKIDTSANSPFRNSGGGEKFLRFISEELIPAINSKYNTAPFTLLFGHSLGGLMGLYALGNASPFNAYITISPSLQWDRKTLLNRMPSNLKGINMNGKFLFFSDANEDSAFHSNQIELEKVLQAKNNSGLKYKRAFYPEESHISEPVKGLYDGLRFIYPDWHLPFNSSAFRKKINAKIILEHYNKLSTKYGYTVVPGHDEIIQISRFLRNDPARIDEALKLLEANMQNYPGSAVSADILGDTWMKKGNKAAALTTYQKAFSLDPANTTIKQKIEYLLK